MSEVKLNVELFFRRLGFVLNEWKNATEGDPELLPFPNTGGILLVAGNADEANPYRKTGALQTYLLGYEFPSTLMLITLDSVTFLCSEGKARILQTLENADRSKFSKVEGLDAAFHVKVLVKTKDTDQANEVMQKVLSIIEGVTKDDKKLGCLLKDTYSGKFVAEWNAFLKTQKKTNLVKEALDISSGLSVLLAVKEPEELHNTELACKMTHKLMGVLVHQITATIESEKKITHERLTEFIEAKLEDPAVWKGAKFGPDFDSSYSDWCYTAIIQSGGVYDLKTSAQSSDERLQDQGVILANLGIRYKSYCSNLCRTIMIDPHPSQQVNYTYLRELQTFALQELREGIVVKDFYNRMVSKVARDRPDLEPSLPKSFGFGTGIEFRDSFLGLSPKCSRILKSGMTFSLTVSFANIEDPFDSSKTYALQLIDTVSVGKNSSSIITDSLKESSEIAFFFNDKLKNSKSGSRDTAKSKGAAAPKKNASPRKSGAGLGSASRKGRLRNDGKDIDNELSVKRKTHQKELAERRQEEGLAKYAEDDGTGKGTVVKQWKRFESYQRDRDLPNKVANLKISVDINKKSFILPINGFAVPFHINTLKNVIKQEEGEYTVLRFMFIAPGQITGKKEDTPFEDPNATFIRGLTFRSTDQEHMHDIYKLVTDLKKAVLKREKDLAEKADVVDQAQLIELRAKRPVKMLDISVRPSFDGKRQAGDVEIHQNGLRYQSSLKTDHRIDVLFNNIAHLFWQSCDQELIAILHIHLKSPIFIGKKKVKDLQFYREASEAAFDETGNRKRRRNNNGGDEDELEAEQEERAKRAELDKHFKMFAEKIADASEDRVTVDSPFRELGFQGVPFRANVLMQPTTDCLVHLVEPPFLVVTLADVEVAHLERIQYGLKNFDLVFVFKDFTKAPVHMCVRDTDRQIISKIPRTSIFHGTADMLALAKNSNTIPSGQLENVKEWLDSCDIPFSEGPVNLNWQAIMKTVTDDPYEFFREGGWSFLSSQSDEEEGSGDGEDDDDSEFVASDIPEDSSSDSDSGSAFDENASDSSGTSTRASVEGVSSAEDWSDQEKKAANSDMKKKGAEPNGRHKKRGGSSESESGVSIDSEEEERKAMKKKPGKKR